MNKHGLRTKSRFAAYLLTILITQTGCTATPRVNPNLKGGRPELAVPLATSVLPAQALPHPTPAPSLVPTPKTYVEASPAPSEPVYLLPFKPGKSYLVTQGYLEEYSHEKSYALDFDLKMGDQIHAARDGLVVNVIQHFPNNPVDRKGMSVAKIENKDKANLIKIRHEDNSIAWYFHLTQNGAVVKLGDEVKAGDLIAYSGNSGYTSGPHLHFIVTRKPDSEPANPEVNDNSIGGYFRICGFKQAIITEGKQISSLSMIKALPCN
jgi:hypothetical protein